MREGPEDLVSSVDPAEVGNEREAPPPRPPPAVGPQGAAQVSLHPGRLHGQGRCAVCGQAHLFPIDVARSYGDHGGLAHKPCQEGAHAQGGSVYPGDENTKATGLSKPCRGTDRAQVQQKPRKGADKRGSDCTRAFLGRAAPVTWLPAWGGDLELQGDLSPTPLPGLGSTLLGRLWATSPLLVSPQPFLPSSLYRDGSSEGGGHDALPPFVFPLPVPASRSRCSVNTSVYGFDPKSTLLECC